MLRDSCVASPPSNPFSQEAEMEHPLNGNGNPKTGGHRDTDGFWLMATLVVLLLLLTLASCSRTDFVGERATNSCETGERGGGLSEMLGVALPHLFRSRTGIPDEHKRGLAAIKGHCFVLPFTSEPSLAPRRDPGLSLSQGCATDPSRRGWTAWRELVTRVRRDPGPSAWGRSGVAALLRGGP